MVLSQKTNVGIQASTFHEIRAGLRSPRARLRLSSPDNEWAIDFDTDRITLQKNMTKPKGRNMGTLEEFGNEVVEFCKRILRQFPKKGTRLSLVTEGFMREMPEEKLRTIYDRLFRPVQFYAENAPVEWWSRSAARAKMDINGREELLNVITNVNRVQGELPAPDGMMAFDRIQVGFDMVVTSAARLRR